MANPTTFDIFVDGGGATSTDATVTASIAPASAGGTTTNLLTVNSGGAGGASPQTFDGSSPVTISYNTVGAPSITGTNASGTWSISVTGNAGTVTNGVYTTGSYADPTFITSLAGSKISGNISGSAATLTTGRTISTTGDISYTSGSFNGSANVTGTATLATVNSNIGTFGSASSIPVVTVNGKGLITAVTTATVAGGQYFGSATTKAIAYNSNTIGENVTVTAGNNGISAGPITVSSGFTVTVQTGSRWVIV